VPGHDDLTAAPRRGAAFAVGFRGRILGHRIEYGRR
jgi:hypothetical protein